MNAARASFALGILALAAGAWLSFPRSSAHANRRALAIVLVDTSKSVVATRPFWSTWIRSEIDVASRAATASNADIALVAFGSYVRRVRGPAATLGDAIDVDRELMLEDRARGEDATRLERALAFCHTLAHERSHARILVLGDATYTGADPRAEAAACARDGIELELRAPPPPALSDLGIGRLDVPRSIEVGAPLVVASDVWWTPGENASDLTAELEVERTDGAGTTRSTVVIALANIDARSASGTSRWPVHVDVGFARAGAIDIRVRVRLRGRDGFERADPILENDVSSTVVRCQGSIVCGVTRANDGAKFSPNSSLSGLDFVPIDDGALGSMLANVDVVLTLDRTLDEGDEALLASFVRAGGGWIDAAGWRWLRARSDERAPLAKIAALSPADDEIPPRDVICLADASGSMSGAPFESVRAAITRLIDLVPPRDTLEARFFANALSMPIALGDGVERADPARRRALVERIHAAGEPSGPTRLWLALDALARERARATGESLVFLLTDGRDPVRAELAQRGPTMRKSLEIARAKLVVIATGADPDRELLSSLLAPGETLLGVPDLARPAAPEELARIFDREIARAGLRTGNTAIAARMAGESGLASEIARATGQLPDVMLSARARASPTAEIAWTTARGEPICAVQRVGRGLVCGLAFQPTSEWAPEWAGRADLFAPLVRFLGRARAEAKEPPLSLVSERGEIVLAHVPADFPASVRARARRAGGQSLPIVLVAGGASHDPRAERRAPIPSEIESTGDDARWIVALELPDREPVELPLVIARAPEFAEPPVTFVPLPPGAVDAAARTRANAPAPHDAAAPALAAAVLWLAAAAFLGVFSRRGG